MNRPAVRLLSVGHCARLSGGELALARMAPLLPAHRFELVSLLGEDGPLVPLLARSCTVEVDPLPRGLSTLTQGSGSRPFRHLGVIPSLLAYSARLVRQIRRIRPDVLHINTMRAGLYAVPAARIAGVPVVWHVRDLLGAQYGGSSVVAAGVRALLKWGPNLIISNSNATQAAASAKGRGPVIYDGVEDARSLATTYGGGEFRVLMVGRMAHWKGQDVALQAARQLRDSGVDIRLDFVGDALFEKDRDFFESIRHDVEEAADGDWVKFLGFVSDVDRLYARSHAMLHCSRLPEPYGQVIVESLAHGVPTIASRPGGPSEILTGDLGDLLIDCHPDAAAAALRRVLEPWAWRRYSTAGVKRARDFAIDGTTAQFVEAIRGVA